MRKLYLLTILLITIIAQSVFSQSTDYYFFDQGVNFYRQKNFSAAKANFLKITSEFPDSKIMTVSLLMLMRSQYQLKEYQMAEASGNLLIKKFPKSSYKDDAYYWMGCIKLQVKQNQHAVLYWLLSFKYADDPRLKDMLSEYLRKAMTNLLSEPELDRLANNLDDTDLKIIAQISYAKILLSERKFAKASTILKNLLRLYPEHAYISWAKKIYSTIPENRMTSKKMVLSIPISGDYGEIGKAFLSGFQYAQRNSEKAPVIIIDDANSSLNAINEVKHIVENDDVWAIIGSLSDEVSASLATLSYYNQIPLISPTASNKKIHNISSQYFQINPDPFHKGKALAEFAKDNLAHKNIAIMAPSDNYGDEFVAGFKSVWSDSDSVRYISEELFDPNTNSFLNQLKKIRKKALRTFFADSIKLEEPEITEDEMWSMYQVWLEEKMEKLEEKYGRAVKDTTAIPIENIDLFVSAIYNDQVEPFARQYTFFNFKSQLIGNEGWYDPLALEKIKNYTNGLIFLTPLFLDDENNNYKNFRNSFRMTMKTTPEQMHVLGYNIARWLQPLLENCNSKAEFKKELQSSEFTNGIGQKINYSNGDRINKHLNIIQYKFGHFFKIN